MDFFVNERDMRFVLFEYLKVQELTEIEKWSDFDLDTFKMTLSEAIKFAGGVTAPLNADADVNGATWEDGQVHVPKGFKEAFEQYVENGWLSMAANPDYGGQGFPMAMSIACGEAFIGANGSFEFTPELARSAAAVIESHGSDELKETYVEKMFGGVWGGTMCLTEPGAGSAVGDTKTKAFPQDDGTYKIEGNKSFITSGDQDITENIIHLVLARTPDAPPGIKGISLLVVPKYKINADGSSGESNDVQCTGIEEKMGIHGSPTCSLAFGENGNCVGYILGEENKGIIYMFQMMNEARIAVGLQGMAMGAMSYELSVRYAKDRVQGTDVMAMKDPNAPRVPIIKHPDVRRNLMLMKTYTEGGRALLYLAGMCHDLHTVGDEKASNLLELLTPICKAYCSDNGFKLTELGIQVHGGYGYCREYGMEQLCRDVKIASLYEGTNGIQALDLIGRKLSAKGGAVLMAYLNKVNTFVAKAKKHPELGDLGKDLEEAKNRLVKMTMGLRGKIKENPYFPVAYATPMLEMFGEVTYAYLLLDMAHVAYDELTKLYEEKGATDDAARRKLDAEHPEATFYSGKIHSARFFIKQVLPGVHAKAMSMDSSDMTVMDVEL